MKSKAIGLLLAVCMLALLLAPGARAMSVDLMDVEVSTDITGISIKSDEDPAVHFGTGSSLMPGDTVRRAMVISNTLKDPCVLTLRSEDMYSTPGDFVNKIQLTITMDGKTVYDGLLSGGLDAKGNALNTTISLGKIQPRRDHRLQATFYFPGKDLDNRYKEAKAATRWILEAEMTPPASSSAPVSSAGPDSSSAPGPSSSLPAPSSSGKTSTPAASSRPGSSHPPGSSHLPVVSAPSQPPSVSSAVASRPAVSRVPLPNSQPVVTPGTTGGGRTPTPPADPMTPGQAPPEQTGEITIPPAGENTMNIFGNEVALGGLRRNDVWSLLNLILSCLAALAALVLIFSYLWQWRHRGDEQEEREQQEQQKKPAAENSAAPRSQPRDDGGKKRSTILRWLSVLVGVATPILFLVLENLLLPMAFVNRWTPLIVCVYLVHLVLLIVFFVLRRRRRDDHDDPGEQPPPQSGEEHPLPYDNEGLRRQRRQQT